MSGPLTAFLSDIGSTGNSSRYLPKFLILVLIVIFVMVEEYIWFQADDFENATIISPNNANNDIQFAQSPEDDRTKIEISDISSNNIVYNTKSDNSKPCREATVKGTYYLH